jgi:hypothetical protein
VGNRAGSTPAPGTIKIRNYLKLSILRIFLFAIIPK